MEEKYKSLFLKIILKFTPKQKSLRFILSFKSKKNVFDVYFEL